MKNFYTVYGQTRRDVISALAAEYPDTLAAISGVMVCGSDASLLGDMGATLPDDTLENIHSEMRRINFDIKEAVRPDTVVMRLFSACAM